MEEIRQLVQKVLNENFSIRNENGQDCAGITELSDEQQKQINELVERIYYNRRLY